MSLDFFTRERNPKLIALGVLGLLVVAHLVSYLVWNKSFDHDDFLFRTQINKLATTKTPVQTVIIGDSAAGLGLDAETFSTLSGQPTLNVALTRLNGFTSSLMMLKQTRFYHPEVKNVIIVQSLDIWNLPFSREWFFRTEKGIATDEIDSHFFPTYKWLDRIAYRSDFKWLYRYAKFVVSGTPQFAIEHDYIKINLNKTYHNGKLVMEPVGIPVTTLDQTVKDGYPLLDTYCATEHLNCIYVSAPLHETTYQHTGQKTFDLIYNFLDTAKTIHVVPTIFDEPNEYMLDSISHLYPEYRTEVTRQYYNAVKELLVP
jgi:hypothetical protein